MARVRVQPETFSLVDFDAAEIAAVAAEVADAVGIGADVELTIEVDETVMVGSAASRIDGDAIVVAATGGAFESLRKARQFDETRCRTVLAHALLRARDRLDPSFGDPAPDADLSVQQEVAWATSIEGRLDRLGLVHGRPQRRIYHFRVRHGFNDTVDQVFDRLWTTDAVTWSDITTASAEAESAGHSIPA